MRINPIQLMSSLRYLASVSLLLLASCGGGGGGATTTTPPPPPPPPPTSFTIGGTITGLTGSGLKLRNNGGDDLSVTAGSTSYTFTTSVASGGSYNVTVLTNPGTPTQVCTIANASGGSLSANVTNANVTCVNAYTISGTITGDVTVATASIGPTLQNNLGDNLFIPVLPASGVPASFTFSTPVISGGTYSVTQLSRASAPVQDCVVTSGSGTGVVANITTVAVACTKPVSIPPAQFAYVTNSTANTVQAYTINTGAPPGGLTPVGTATATGNGPYSVSVGPGSKYAYVVNSNDHTISAYSIGGTGALTLLADVDAGTPGNQTSIATGNIPYSVTVHPSGKFAYVANEGVGVNGNSISAYSINASGALATIDADGVTTGTQAIIVAGTNPLSVVVDPTGKFAYAANYASDTVSAYTIDQITGALTPVAGSPFAVVGGPSAVAIDPTGKCALVANNTADNVKSYTINATTGALALVSTVVSGAAGSAPRGVSIDPATGLYAYVANANSASVSGFSLVPATCVIASIDTDAVLGGVNPTIAAGTVPFSVNVDASGKYVYVANFSSNNVSAYSINGAGALTPLSTPTYATGTGPTSVTTAQ